MPARGALPQPVTDNGPADRNFRYLLEQLNQLIISINNYATGAAGGDLTGTYPNPTIGTGKVTSTHILDGTIVNADVNASAAIAYGKLALTGAILNADISPSAAIAYSKLNLSASIVNADIATGAAIAYAKLALTGAIVNADVSASAAIAYSKLNLSGSIVNADISGSAAIANSKLATNPLARANHTGTQTASTVSDFDAQVRTSRLDQMATPSTDLAMGSHKITGLTAGTASGHAVEYDQLEIRAQQAENGFRVKAPVELATSSSLPAYARVGNTLTASANGKLSNVDGLNVWALYTDVHNDGLPVEFAVRILVKNEATAADNGIYYLYDRGSVSTPWILIRATDADEDGEVLNGNLVDVLAGVTNEGRRFYLATSNPITVNTTGQIWTEYPSRDSRISAYGSTLVDDADAAAARVTLGLTGQGSIWVPPMFGATGTGSPTANMLYFARVHIPAGSDAITGIEFRPTNTTGSCKALLFDSAGTQLAISNAATLAGSGFGAKQQVAFTASYTPAPATYWIGLAFNNAGSVFVTTSGYSRGGTKSSAYTTPGNITPATDVGTGTPYMHTY